MPDGTGRHRGEHRDPVGNTLTALWLAGHLAVATLLGVDVHQQLDAHLMPAPRSVPTSDSDSTS
ncbi:hypothetical protein [Kitasatospora acidiphila]|uniref:hypothetical protein n=1 Tax=Kitasatospora acidiphila TaxID=2567942 RepID=UPI003C73C91A